MLSSITTDPAVELLLTVQDHLKQVREVTQAFERDQVELIEKQRELCVAELNTLRGICIAVAKFVPEAHIQPVAQSIAQAEQALHLAATRAYLRKLSR